MAMPRAPLQSILKVFAAIDPDLAMDLEDEEIGTYLERLVHDMDEPTIGLDTPVEYYPLAGPYFDQILNRIQKIDDDTEMLRHVCAQEASRLYQVYFLDGDYLLLEKQYDLPHNLFK
jgi:hypothetical protein